MDLPVSTNSLTPLRFTPLFKTALWGGARLRSLFGVPPSADPTGEAWVLSDQGDNQSVVAAGRWAGTTLRQLLERWPERILGRTTPVQGRFPILLKFIQARKPLSVQVHPTDAKARELEGPTAVGKTEAWIVLEADPSARMYTGLQPGVMPEQLRRAIAASKSCSTRTSHRWAIACSSRQGQFTRLAADWFCSRCSRRAI